MADTTFARYLRLIGDIPILTREEESVLFGKIKQGCIVSRNKFVEHNMRLVVSVARKRGYFRADIDPMDLVGAGNIGLFSAIDKFDPSRGWRFATFAEHCINAEMIRFLKRIPVIRSPYHGKRPVKTVISADRENEEGLFIKDILTGETNSHEVFVMRQQLKDVFKTLAITKKEKSILKKRMQGETLESIARPLGLTRERIRQLQAIIVKRIKVHIKMRNNGLTTTLERCNT